MAQSGVQWLSIFHFLGSGSLTKSSVFLHKPNGFPYKLHFAWFTKWWRNLKKILEDIIFSFLPFSKEDTQPMSPRRALEVQHFKYPSFLLESHFQKGALLLPFFSTWNVCHRYFWHTQYAPVDWACLSHFRHLYLWQTHVCRKYLVAYTSMTRVSSFENGRNEKIISFSWKFSLQRVLPNLGSLI